MKYRVLFQTCPIWKPGERDVDASARRIQQADLPPSERYPGDYAGKVISILPSERNFHREDVASPCRMAVVLDLTEEDRHNLMARTHKIGRGLLLEEVTFDDRWGAVAETLRANIEAPESAERGDIYDDIEAKRFDELSALATRSLPQVEVHTGAGLYEVGPTKTYATIQSALDQLWIDQGSATFTATQYIRVFADTYDENVTPNSGFVPDRSNGFLLVVEGDPVDVVANIVLGPTSGLRAMFVACDQITIRHMTLTNAGGATLEVISATSANFNLILEDAILVGGGVNVFAISRTGGALEMTDCVLETPGFGLQTVEGTITQCIIRHTGGVGKRGLLMNSGSCGLRITATVIDSWDDGIGASIIAAGPTQWCLRNVTFYKCTTAIENLAWAVTSPMVINCIFDSCGTVFEIPSYPEEAGTKIGSRVLLRNNCYYNYTTFANDLSTTKTYAEFIALNRVDHDGDLDATDPEMVDPDNQDYSLGTGSPCRHAGHGSGVVRDYLGTAFDPASPDIGGWSSGLLPAATIPNIPSITAMVNVGDGDGVTVSVSTDVGSKVFVLSRIRNSAEPWTAFGSRTGSGDIAATGYTNNSNYESIAIATFGTLVSDNPSQPSAPVSVYVTDSAGFYSNVRQALYDWVDGELGIPTIWQHPNAPQPAKPYATINMGPTQSQGWDYHGPPDDVNGVSVIKGDREFTVQVQIYGTILPSGENQALTFSEQIASSLQKRSVVALFTAAGFAYVNRVAMTDLSDIGGTEFEARFSSEFLFRMAQEDTDTVGAIETVAPIDGTLGL